MTEPPSAQSGLALMPQEMEDASVIAKHYHDATRWVERDDHGYQPEKIADIRRRRDLCERMMGWRCECVCHVGVDGQWRAHACDCPDCPSGAASDQQQARSDDEPS